MLSDVESELGAALHDGGIVRVGAAVNLYIRYMRPLYRADTIRGRRQTLERFARHHPQLAIKAVKPRHVTDWLAEQHNGPASTRTLLSHLRCFFRWAVEHGHLKNSPTLLVRSPKQPRGIPRSLTLEELRAVGTALPDERAVLIITLMIDLGLRRGEVSRLDVADVDMRAKLVRIQGKGGHERLLPITPAVELAIAQYVGVRGRMAGPLIRSSIAPYGGILPDTIGKLVSRWLKDAGVKEDAFDGRSAHALRHSMAENLYRHGTDLRTIAAALGHASPSTTWIYLRSSQSVEDLRAVMGQQYIDEPRPHLRPVYETPNSAKKPFPRMRFGLPAMAAWAFASAASQVAV